jgi:G1/S-specific cyclin PLC1
VIAPPRVSLTTVVPLADFEPFLSQYCFETSAPASPVMAPMPMPEPVVVPVPVVSQPYIAPAVGRKVRTVTRGENTFVYPGMDRSGSCSSLESVTSTASTVLQTPPASPELPARLLYNKPQAVKQIQRSQYEQQKGPAMHSSHLKAPAPVTIAGEAPGLIERLMRMHGRRKPVPHMQPYDEVDGMTTLIQHGMAI